MSDQYLLRVQNPMTHTTDQGRFTSYLIYMETDNVAYSLKQSSIRRRYSEFLWLKDILARNHPDLPTPPLPRKTFFRDRFDPALIEDRKTGLEEFLHKIISITPFLSNNAVHLFLQSPLSTRDIEHVVAHPTKQTIAEIILAHGEEAQGICQECHGNLYPENELQDPVSAPSSLPGFSPSEAVPCPHDIFSPTRPHSFDFSHCITGDSMSYDSSDEIQMNQSQESTSGSK